MVVGYVTVAEADAYITSRYLYTDSLRVDWESLDAEEKSVYLLRSVEALDTLPYVGRPFLVTQEYAFPRYPSTVVPVAVKRAQIENALQLTSASSGEDAELYSKLRMYGVMEYSIGNLSEKLVSGQVVASKDLVSSKSVELLKPYLGGGYSIR